MYFHAPAALLAVLAVPFTTASPVSLPRAGSQGCSDTSFQSFEWIARSFDFHASYVFSTPAHQNSWGYVSFDLYNIADQSTAHCEAQSNQLNDFFYGNMPYTCNDTLRSGSTTFDFARPNNRLRVNQTWTCPGSEPQWPITFTGYGDANFTLECTESAWQNPNWTLGQIYSTRDIKCATVDGTVKPTQLTAVA